MESANYRVRFFLAFEEAGEVSCVFLFVVLLHRIETYGHIIFFLFGEIFNYLFILIL